MRETDVLTQFFADQLGQDYDVQSFRNSLLTDAPASEIMRTVLSTEELIVKALENGKTRGILRTGQSDYIALQGVAGASFSWALDLAAEVDNVLIDSDLERVIADFTERVVPVVYKGEDFRLTLTFTMPAKFISLTNSGTTYQQVVLGGKATLTNASELANDYAFYIDNTLLRGVVSFSSGFSVQGENYNEAPGSLMQKSALQSFTNGLSFQLHVLKDDSLLSRITLAAFNGDVEPFDICIKKRGIKIARYPFAKLEQCTVGGSIGGYVLAEIRFLRE